jgi:catechol 2,3-dioxygenase-like lactoylglutathione lyase family enzyme
MNSSVAHLPWLASTPFSGAAHFASMAFSEGSKAGDPPQPGDPMEAQSDPRKAIASPLKIITITTGDLEATRRFYQGALGMTPAFHHVTGPAAQKLIAHWRLSPASDLRMITFTRPGLADAIMVRAIQTSATAPTNRPGYLSEYYGALGIGLPVSGIPRRDAIVQSFGFSSVAGPTELAFPRADETTYKVGEIHYEAPDDILVLGVDRGGMRPVGPIDPALDIGGPAYSSSMVSNAEAIAPLFKDVLGLEIRRSFVFMSKGAQSGMRLPAGVEVLFQQWFSPGATTGYLLQMQPLNAGAPAPQGIGPKNRGIAMWSFDVRSLEQIVKRAQHASVPVVSPPAKLDFPGLGPTRSMVLATPDGFLVEVNERPAALP